MSKNSSVLRMASVNITGNVISLSWFNHVKMESGKPDTIAIMLLGDIVYWYRPIEIRNEETGQFIEYRKKFAADKLQRSYGAFADLYGYTKNQVTDALKRLEVLNLIDLDFRHPTINGIKLGNVLYIGLNVDRLVEITSPLSDLNGIGYGDKSVDPLDFKGDTNTETTTETTQVNISASIDLFTGYLGKFNSEKEALRWVALYEAVGAEKAEALASWALKKEIHMINRAGLLDSLETASKNWYDKPARANGNGKKSNMAALDQLARELGA